MIYHSGLHNLNDYTDFSGRNLAHIAACENNVDIIRFLFEFDRNFDFTKKDERGKRPMDEAVFFGNKEIVEILEQKTII